MSDVSQRPTELIPGLRSPTGQTLVEDGGRLIAADGRSYPVVSGVPILVDDDRSIFRAEDIAERDHVEAGVSVLRGLVRRAVPDHTLAIGTAEHYTEFARRIGSGRVLVIGGGALGQGAQPLIDSAAEIVETDVYISGRVDVVCDAHDLPFADETFDGVVLQAVLEHVLDPVRAVAEAHRVLKADGLIYAETPFLQAVHEGAYDFTRWTELGHRRLFRMFSQIDSGVIIGPATSLLWAIRYFARSLPARGGAWSLLADKVATLLFFWLKYLDRVLIEHPGAVDAASGVYFMGQKATSPVADQEVLAGYRGTVGRPVRAEGT